LRDTPLRRIAVLGPAHYVPLAGIAVPAVAAFATPTGEVPVEVHTCAALAERHEWVTVDDHPHLPEHSIEVQLPFLQRMLARGWTCVPLVVGATVPEQVADVLDTLCTSGDMLPVVSTDLSHYLDQASAQRRDRQTARAVVDRDADAIGGRDACGAFALRGLLHWASRHELDVRLLYLGTSADAGADPGRVVGYGAFGAPGLDTVTRRPALTGLLNISRASPSPTSSDLVTSGGDVCTRRAHTVRPSTQRLATIRRRQPRGEVRGCLSHTLSPSEALSEAARLALLARLAAARSRSLARVGRCGLAGAEASDSR
jgi:AmmeMemoRadiSam system protein B